MSEHRRIEAELIDAEAEVVHHAAALAASREAVRRLRMELAEAMQAERDEIDAAWERALAVRRDGTASPRQ